MNTSLHNIGLFLCLLIVSIGIGMVFFSRWQFDIIEVRPTWDTKDWIRWFQESGYSRYADVPYQCSELWRTNIGRAYDTLLTLAIMSPFMVMIGMSFLLFDKEIQNKKLRLDNKRLLGMIDDLAILVPSKEDEL